MLLDTSQKIVKYIRNNGQVTASEIADYLDITDRAVRKQFKNLLEAGVLKKIGKPPKVFYLLNTTSSKGVIGLIDKNEEKIINYEYLFITPDGERKNGVEGFAHWCERNNLPLEKTAHEYIKTLKKYNKFKKNGFINGMTKIKSTFKSVGLDGLFYLDFYSIERFGKTKLGQMLLYAKQSQNRKLIKELILNISDQVYDVVKKNKIDGIGFIPPTVKREVQFMKELQKNLHPTVRVLKISKIKTEVTVPQKTLNKLNDRIENARRTIVVEDFGVYKNILLIDDAVGSGATLNETALQIRKRRICKGKIIGLAITGSVKGFDVISEV